MSDPSREPSAPTPEQLEATIELLEALVGDRGLLAGVDRELRERLLIAAGKVSRPAKQDKRRLVRARKKQAAEARQARDEALLSRTQIRKLRENPIFQTPRSQARFEGRSEPIGEVEDPRVCYACQAKYTQVHFFYDHMCVDCGDFNFGKRTQTADLRGRVALVTGSRVKIGYQAAILLLRAGCHVICTTRFPKDAARRYAREADFAEWSDRLEIHGIDLRDTRQVEALCARLLRTHSRLDFIINNACQTVRRPPGFYDHLLDGEHDHTLSAAEAKLLGTTGPAGSAAGGGALTDGADANGAGTEAAEANGADALATAEPLPLSPAELTQLQLIDEDRQRGEQLFPEGRLDADLQQVDLRTINSWRLRAHEVSTVELLEVQLVNAIAPYVINTRLKPLMLAVPTRDKHVVNVSAMEGQFYKIFKSDKHPHTNMAKAALNMLTRTAAMDYVADGIHMNSVDTGWVTDEDPAHHAARKREIHRFHPPLDIVDGAARIVDPIFDGINTGEHVWGQFLKDYKVTDW